MGGYDNRGVLTQSTQTQRSPSCPMTRDATLHRVFPPVLLSLPKQIDVSYGKFHLNRTCILEHCSLYTFGSVQTVHMHGELQLLQHVED